MNNGHLKTIHSLTIYSMALAKSPVMAQAWFVSTKCRHAVRGGGLLRTLREDLA